MYLLPLGTIEEIAVSWSISGPTPALDALGYATWTPDAAAVPQRLMTFTGVHRRATLLIVPCRTTTGLAFVVLRIAAALTVPAHQAQSAAYETACKILRAQDQAASAALTGSRRPGAPRGEGRGDQTH
jgi:hypothetical protein